MFSIKLSEICVFLIHTILFIEAYNNTLRKTAIINKFCENNFWKNLSNLQKVRYANTYCYLNKINIISNKSKSNGKIRCAALFLSCLYAQDLRQIFLMVNDYQNICKTILENNNNPYQCIIHLLEIIKKVTLLGTVIKESLIAVDALYHRRPNKTKDDYILYDFLSSLQQIKNTIVHESPSQDNPKNCEIILLNIKNIFNVKIEYINKEIKGKRKRECLFKNKDFYPILHDWKTVHNIENELYYFKDLNEKIDDEFKKIITDKYYKLGFHFNTSIKMISIPIPQEVLNKKGKKSESEVAELLDFLEQALT
ncbi:uncharacterized protein LOC126907572 isoform X2 [Daktulosphaira vitifoliae]|uniref:uncharacterized protein LOC126907572 isoform X2 n=1 Tax=Daktulosphaira vitifoliae TaxID=58002 RepID=UPI0021AA2C73|nr:uncharacterized protein LOC126907572 isoform X2 [Daktulosphaira vitifoliae]